MTTGTDETSGSGPRTDRSAAVRCSRGLVGAFALVAVAALGACAPDPGTDPSASTTTTSTSTVPTPARTVTISRGPRVSHHTCNHPSCAYLDVTARGFAPSSVVQVQCWAHLNGEDEMFHAFLVPTDSTGTATGRGCWFGYPGAPVWVVVDGVRSNILGWWSGPV